MSGAWQDSPGLPAGGGAGTDLDPARLLTQPLPPLSERDRDLARSCVHRHAPDHAPLIIDALGLDP